jgi:hypothetical protein
MAPIVQIRTEVIHRFIFELRYEEGFLYWDRAGAVARELSKGLGWKMQAIDTNHCILKKAEENLTFSFGPHKLDLTQSQNESVAALLPASEFAGLADRFSDTVMRYLDSPYPLRIGFRVWRLYPTKSQEDAECRVRQLKFYRLDPSVPECLGRPSEASFSLVV